jgi:hypothetical protein
VCSTALDRYNFCVSTDVMLAGCSTCHGIFLTHDDLMRLDERDKRLEKGGGTGLNEAEAEAVGFVDSQIAHDTFRSRLAAFNWQQLDSPAAFHR